MEIAEQVVLITGGASGIGRYLVAELAQEARELVVIDKDAKALDRLHSDFPNLKRYVCDLTEPAQVQRTIDSVYQDQAKVSVLINNAGLIHSEPFINLLAKGPRTHHLQNWHTVLAVNLHSVFYVTSCVVDRMVEYRTKGLIVNISSISSAGNAGQSAYSAAKAGVNALTVTWSKELGMFGIRSVGIAPGFLDTPSTRAALSEANIRKWEKNTPAGRLGTLKEIASSVRFIIQNDFYNGRILELDGGLRI
jgi:3-oxoacyl-[acyl-carrier protein] reductase